MQKFLNNAKATLRTVLTDLPYACVHHVSEKKTSTHIIGYKLRNSCLILIIFDTKIPHII